MFTSVLTASDAAKLGYGVVTVQGTRTNLVFVQEYSVYSDAVVGGGSGGTVGTGGTGDTTVSAFEYGIGLRVVVTIASNEKSLDVSSLPLIAASVSTKRASATARFQVLGFIGQKASDLVPAPMELTASTLVALNDGFNKIKSLIYNPTSAQSPPDPATVMVAPQLLRISVPRQDLEAASGTSRGR